MKCYLLLGNAEKDFNRLINDKSAIEKYGVIDKNLIEEWKKERLQYFVKSFKFNYSHCIRKQSQKT